MNHPRLCAAEADALAAAERLLMDIQARARRLDAGRDDTAAGVARYIQEEAARAERLISLVLRGPQPGDDPADDIEAQAEGGVAP